MSKSTRRARRAQVSPEVPSEIGLYGMPADCVVALKDAQRFIERARAMVNDTRLGTDRERVRETKSRANLLMGDLLVDLDWLVNDRVPPEHEPRDWREVAGGLLAVLEHMPAPTAWSMLTNFGTNHEPSHAQMMSVQQVVLRLFNMACEIRDEWNTLCVIDDPANAWFADDVVAGRVRVVAELLPNVLLAMLSAIAGAAACEKTSPREPASIG